MFFRYLSLLVFGCCFVYANVLILSTKQIAEFNHNISIGGWYPIFIESMPDKQLTKLIDKIQTKKAQQIIVNYDLNYDLATKVSNYISNETKSQVILHQEKTTDGLTHFKHNIVVVIVK